jgi:uncharacterized membrane protein (UPF0182 family)
VRIPSDLPPRRRPRARKRKRSNTGRIVVGVVLSALVLLFVSARGVSSFYVDYLWFDSVGRNDVFWGVLWSKVQLALGFSLAFVLFGLVSTIVADRLAPNALLETVDDRVVARYRALTRRQRMLLRTLVVAVLGFLAGLPAASQWESWLLFRNSRSFGVSDPLFDVDVGFYVFRLPFLQFLVSWLFAAFVMVSLLTAGAYYLNGSIRFQGAPPRVAPHVKVHLSVLFAVAALLKAAGYWLQRFDLTRSTRGVVQGATYTDVNAQLPVLNLLILVSLAIAVLFLVNIRQKGWRLPVLAVGIWAVVAVVAGAIYPAIVQRFVVQPNVSTRELPYIDDNLAATQAAMDIADVETVPFMSGQVSSSEVEADQAVLRDVRLLDAAQMRDRFSLDQGLRSFYTINDLDVDRYVLDGREQQVMVAARELSTANIPNNTWVSRHLLYTHGCGLVAAPASSVTDDGRPDYVELPIEEPRIYYGEDLPSYAVVDTDQAEQPCPGAETQRYEGLGGVELNSVLRRLAFAIDFGEYNLFGSRLITGESRVMIERDVRERVHALAPFLAIDADPYPVELDGRILWIVDTYTTTNRYPYAQRANTSQLSGGSGLDTSFNYVRNSVKAVVDAYDGSVTFYVADPNDPIVRAWSGAFPDLFTPMSEAPTGLAEHFRYPEDLFRVQTNIYGKYQFDDPNEFFNRDAAWSVAQAPPLIPEATNAAVTDPDAVVSDSVDVADPNVERFEPYYTIFHPPGGGDPEFSMLRPFVPFSTDDSRKELRAFMTVSSAPDTYGKLTVYSVTDPLPPGPATVAAEIESTPEISSAITLLDQQGSDVVFGTLQVLPVGDGLIYVRPLYVRPDDTNAKQVFLRRMIAWYDNRAVIASTLSEAINRLFPSAELDLGDVVGGDGEPVEPDTPSEPAGDETAAELLLKADTLFEEADAALAENPPDFATYADKQAEARELLERALALLGTDASS